MKIAIEGCAHGELEKIYDTIGLIEKKENIKIDLLICCGDFQSTRNENDLACMACPPKYRNMCSFYKYYSGEKLAPILTLFIGGNHEASSYLQELPYGGWVAPNIFYFGYAGVVNIGGLRIGGISGIQKGGDFLKGHFEKAPYNENTKRSVYHIRTLEVFRLKQLSGEMDIMCSHDWPKGIYHHGNVDELLKFKPYFQGDVAFNRLGSACCEDLLYYLRPKYWFSAHLHVKFSAQVTHDDSTVTKFLALDKCLPKRKFLQVIDIEHDPSKGLELKYDHEWLTILFLTNHLLNIKTTFTYMPGPNFDKERYEFTPSEEELKLISEKFHNNFTIPNNFIQTVEPFNPTNQRNNYDTNEQSANTKIHPITKEFCDKLSIDDPLQLVLRKEESERQLNNSSGASSPFQNISMTKSSFGNSSLGNSSLGNSSPVITTPKINKLNLPLPKNKSKEEQEQDELVLNSSVDSTLLNESIESSDVNSSFIDDTILLSAKKFKPYKSSSSYYSSIKNTSLTESTLNSSLTESTSNSSLPESPLASILPQPKSSLSESPSIRSLPKSSLSSILPQPKNSLSESPSSIKNSSLPQSPLASVLPQPKFSIKEELNELGAKETCLSKPVSNEIEQNIGTGSNGSGNDLDNVLENNEDKPVIKKFKRRNQSMYRNENDE